MSNDTHTHLQTRYKLKNSKLQIRYLIGQFSVISLCKCRNSFLQDLTTDIGETKEVEFL